MTWDLSLNCICWNSTGLPPSLQMRRWQKNQYSEDKSHWSSFKMGRPSRTNDAKNHKQKMDLLKWQDLAKCMIFDTFIIRSRIRSLSRSAKTANISNDRRPAIVAVSICAPLPVITLRTTRVRRGQSLCWPVDAGCAQGNPTLNPQELRRPAFLKQRCDAVMRWQWKAMNLTANFYSKISSIWLIN